MNEPEGRGGVFESLDNLKHRLRQKYWIYLDKTTIYRKTRWLVLFALVALYSTRVYFLGGFYIITYALGIFLLNMLIGFLSPLVDPEFEDPNQPVLPTGVAAQTEYKPFLRKINEFKFWHEFTVAVVLAFFCTFFSFLDLPVFWPILLFYFIALFGWTMRTQITRMIKFRYLPLNIGKPKYNN